MLLSMGGVFSGVKPLMSIEKINMSLLPRIPCRKLWIVSRFAVPGGSATEFEIEVPQGGLDLPDNCVGFIDSISVPSFPNVFEGRDLLYVRESAEDVITFRAVRASSDNYNPNIFAQHLQDKLLLNSSLVDNQHVSDNQNSAPFTGAANDYAQIVFELTGPNAVETSSVLTDDDIKTLTDVQPVWDVSGIWLYPIQDLTGAWSVAGAPAITLSLTKVDGWFVFNYSGALGPNPVDRFYVTGRTLHLAPEQTYFEQGTTGDGQSDLRRDSMDTTK